MSGFAFVKVVAQWLLAFVVLYALYGAIVFVRLGDQFPVDARILMVLAPSTVGWALLIAPATFAASATRFDLLTADDAGVRRRYWAQIGLLGLASWLLTALGPPMVLSVLAAAVPQAQGLNNATDPLRPFVSVAFGLFPVLSGVAGALVGRVASRSIWPFAWAAPWFSCLAVVGAFWLSLVGITSLVVQYGLPPAWVAAVPLTLPSVVLAALALHDRYQRGLPVLCTSIRAISNAVDPDTLDAVISGLNEADREANGVIATSPEPADDELTRFIAGIRTVAGPRARVSREQAAEVAAVLSRARMERQGTGTVADPGSQHVGKLLGFCCTWICLAAGLVVVGLVGGVFPSVSAAAAVGLIGAVALWPAVRDAVSPLAVGSARA